MDNCTPGTLKAWCRGRLRNGLLHREDIFYIDSMANAWEGQLASLQKKAAEQDARIVTLEAQLASLREALDRLNREVRFDNMRPWMDECIPEWDEYTLSGALCYIRKRIVVDCDPLAAEEHHDKPIQTKPR